MNTNGVYININYPFKDSVDGFFLDLNNNDKNAIKADLMHLILTNKGERLYQPEFGTNLMKYLFEPKDDITESDIRVELNDTILKYIPNLTITSIKIDDSTNNEYGFIVRIDYEVTEGVFKETDFVIINV